MQHNPTPDTVQVSICPWLLVLMVLLLPASDLFAQEGYVVTDVNFSGNATLSSDQLKEQIAMHGTGGLLGLFSDEEEFLYSRDALEADIERLTRHYQRQGFLDVRLPEPELKVNHSDEQVKVSFIINEGQPVVVDTVMLTLQSQSDTIAGADAVIHVDSILRKARVRLRLSDGVRFRDDWVEQDRRALADHMADNGFPYVMSRPELDVDTSHKSVAITWRVDPGPQSVFGEVTVDGNEDVPADVIVNSTAFESGDAFQQYLLGRTQDWIYGLGAFRIVTVSATLDSVRTRQVPVRIQVEEAPRWSTEFGVGYGREEEFRAHNKSTFIGFLGEVRRLELLVRHSALEPYHVDITWLQPAFLTPRTSAAISPFVRRQTEPGFTLNRLGGDIELRHQFNRDLDASIRYVYEQVDLEEQSVADEEITAPDLEGLYTKSSLIFGATRDNSEPLFSPNRGAQLTSTWKLSGLDLGSAYHFTSILLEGRLYRTLLGVVVAMRLKSGAIESFDGSGFIPVEDRFFSGGSQSIRGWARSQLGPMSGGKPLGGNGLVEGSVELRFPLFWKIGGAVFMDAGNVWRQFEYVSIGELRYSPGVGLRYTTPIGPIRFDAARPVWDTESTWQFHISVGESF